MRHYENLRNPYISERIIVKKIIFMGKTGCGKTTLTKAVRGEDISYRKTQYIRFYDGIIDTPGEYAENKILGRALALYSYEADIVGLLLSATEEYSLFPPCITCMCNREVVGIVTQIDREGARPERARRWLELAGCTKIFYVSSVTGEGIEDIRGYLAS